MFRLNEFTRNQGILGQFKVHLSTALVGSVEVIHITTC